MPNPLTRNTNQSRRAPDRIDAVAETTVPARVLPYRGIETHGVAFTGEFDIDADEADYGTTVAVPIEPEPKEDEPIPVRLVSSGASELKTWRVVREYCRSTESSRQILGLDETRSNTRIRNLHATDVLYVSHESFNDIANAYPVPAGAEFALSTATTPVYAKPAGANDISVAVAFETSINR